MAKKRTHKEADAPADEAARRGSDPPAAEVEDASSEEEQVERDLDELGEAKRERDEYLELARRTKADFENYRKRVARETSEALARGKGELARGLLPVIDNLERALRAAGIEASDSTSEAEGAPDAPSEEVTAHEALARGVALVHRELRGTLEAAGVEAYDPVGQRFDPEVHEALSTRASADGDSGLVLETVEKGYRLDGQVLRPARVVVGE